MGSAEHMVHGHKMVALNPADSSARWEQRRGGKGPKSQSVGVGRTACCISRDREPPVLAERS